ncbi:MAG: ABC transporter permease [Nigerium sp.]|nr:ABC transporter permease [Nigerium sp.]
MTAVAVRTPAASAPSAGSLVDLSLRLTGARLAMREGEGLLYLSSVIAFAVSSALALTVAGGTWMFYQRWTAPTGIHAELIAVDPTFETVISMYFMLALIACALLIPAMSGLASGAAMLGARGRDRRLAVLRLVGLSSADVTRMSLIDTAIQAVSGIALGTLAYFATLPAWGLLTMQAMTVRPAEMLLPWWGILAVCAATFVTGMLASAWGLRRVRISPLGVSKRANSPAMRAWRVAFFAVVLVIALVAIQTLQINGLVPTLIFAAIMLAVIWAFNLFAAWLLQLLAAGLARTPNATAMWASRRVQADAKATWRRVSGLGLLALIGAYLAIMPIAFNATDDAASADFALASQWDFTKGAIITLGVGFALTAMSIFIAQASSVLERAEQTVALANMGAPRSFLTRVMWWETLAPLVVAVALGAGLGILLGLPFVTMATRLGMEDAGAGLPLMGGVLAAGIGLTVAALAACTPLQNRVLASHERRND